MPLNHEKHRSYLTLNPQNRKTKHPNTQTTPKKLQNSTIFSGRPFSNPSPPSETFIIPPVLSLISKEVLIYMAKLSAWLVTLIGALWVVDLLDLTAETVTSGWVGWLVGLAFLAMGVSKLMRNYGPKKR